MNALLAAFNSVPYGWRLRRFDQLFGLPAECRLLIYGYILRDTVRGELELVWNSRTRQLSSNADHSLLLVSKQVRTEACPLIWSLSTVIFRGLQGNNIDPSARYPRMRPANFNITPVGIAPHILALTDYSQASCFSVTPTNLRQVTWNDNQDLASMFNNAGATVLGKLRRIDVEICPEMFTSRGPSMSNVFLLLHIALKTVSQYPVMKVHFIVRMPLRKTVFTLDTPHAAHSIVMAKLRTKQIVWEFPDLDDWKDPRVVINGQWNFPKVIYPRSDSQVSWPLFRLLGRLRQANRFEPTPTVQYEFDQWFHSSQPPTKPFEVHFCGQKEGFVVWREDRGQGRGKNLLYHTWVRAVEADAAKTGSHPNFWPYPVPDIC